MQSYRFKQVDVFTQQPLRGNPVAVVLGAESLTREEMQQIAAWTNLSETTFVLPPSSPQADYRLRIFTPKQELPFAGHPTVGSAHAVIEAGIATPQAGTLRQECLAGLIELTVQATSAGQQIWVQAPPVQISKIEAAQVQQLEQGLGAALASETPPLRIDVGPVWLIANLGSAERVDALQPNMAQLTELSQHTNTIGVTVFGAATDPTAQLHVRSFAPKDGIPEDPVCGSGNVCVAAFLRHFGLEQTYGSEYVARQGMQVGRDGQIFIRLSDRTIQFGGYAVTCVEGSLRAR